ncbi:MAG TPA: ATP-binding protein [Gaiellaceae bacterium]|jgi:signal transduction histidine kinase|nr:ATP-binding protein [Gaiellaceae bacterium]
MPEARRAVERWIAWVRVGGLVFALLEVGIFTADFPRDYEVAAWAFTGALAAGAAALLALAYRAPAGWLRTLGVAALVFDTAVVSAYAVLYSYEYGNQTRFVLVFAVVEAALRYGVAGGVLLPAVTVGPLWLAEWWRVHRFPSNGPPFRPDRVAFPAGLLLLTGVIVGWLVRSRETEARVSRGRALEAEVLRDAAARRVDVLEAANRCARALGSSLELEEAFGAFIRELRGLVPFGRTAIVLVEGDRATTMATAGRGAKELFPPGSVGPLQGSVLERVLEGRLIVRRDLAETEYPEDEGLLALGLRSELVAPLLLGARPIGMLSVSRAQPEAFSEEEVELVSLLGRLVATAVQNIRAYEAERSRVAELRRLSQLRADFVSLVSHELRSPMAAVIGAARTLQERWRMLNSEQRDSFLALIGDETSRLAALVGDVLDTSRIEAGTFSYRFEDLDLARLVEDAVGAASFAQQDVKVVARVHGTLPPVRGDRARLRQVLVNLIDNAVKYSPEGGEVRVNAAAVNGAVRIAVRDEGPGIPHDQRARIFEKFGRADIAGASKPGTGLGLFIARSIAEAHGGTLEVTTTAPPGTTFTLTLPAGG